MRCYGVFTNGRWRQEVYESASRDAGRRARQLRALGLAVVVSALGPQVTRVGTVRLTQVHVPEIPDGIEIPEPEQVVRL